MTEPTDAELIAELEAAGVVFMAFRGGLSGTKELWTTSGSQDAKKIAAGMRAAIAKWGTPPAVAGEPVAVIEFTDGVKEPRIMSWNALPAGQHRVHTTPQPTQPQAGAVPLTNEQIRAMCKEPWIFDTAKQWVRLIEAAHGIKGGQHGIPPTT